MPANTATKNTRNAAPPTKSSGLGNRIGTLAVMFAVLTANAVQTAGAPLQDKVKAALKDARLGSSRVGVVLYDPEHRTVLADFRNLRTTAEGEDPNLFMPASNMKLLSSGTALAVLGADFRFRTEVRVQGDTLVIIGDGDPALADPVLLEDHDTHVNAFLDRWVGAIQELQSQQSPRRPIGEIVLDDRVFDREHIHPSWPTVDLNHWYSASVSGLNFHTNIINVYTRPTTTGAAPGFSISPAGNDLQMENRAKTVKEGKNTIWVARKLGTNSMSLRGNLRWDAETRVAIHEPANRLGVALRDKLEAAGLGRPSIRRPELGETFPESVLVWADETPIKTAIRRCNVDSYNLYADAFFKRVGHEITKVPGSWANGAAVVRMSVQQLVGIAESTLVQPVDGSGLSRENRVSPMAMAKWVSAIATNEDIGSAFLASLPTPGEGTLRKRFKDAELHGTVHAKSGYIRGVSCLSGVVRDPGSGRMVAFSVMVNDIPMAKVPISKAKAFHETIVEIADEWLHQRVRVADADNE